MGALTAEELELALAARAEVAVWREEFRALVAADADRAHPARVHVKHDSGMGRLGNRDPAEVLRLADACADDPALELAGVWTHFATADEPDSEHFAAQLASFGSVAEQVRERHPGVALHAANSAATLRDPASHFDMVRCGIAIYGMDPFGSDPASSGLTPALTLRSYVADVKRFEAGAGAGYGQTWRAGEDTLVGVVPIGYGDGVRRALSNRGEVLIRGRRRADRRDDLHGQPDRGARAGDRREARRRGRPDRRPGRRADPRRGGGRRSSARSTTRSPAASRPGFRERSRDDRRPGSRGAPGRPGAGRDRTRGTRRRPRACGSSAAPCATRRSTARSPTSTSP